MLIVPLAGDTIVTTEGAEYEVESYTNFKPKGPAIYCSAPGIVAGNSIPLVYFFDIAKINGVTVELDNSAKVFKALGKIRRTWPLPQPGDKIHVLKKDTELDQPDDVIEVVKLKLHNKTEGVSKGLLVCGDKHCFMLSDIIRIERSIGSDSFNRKKFLSTYKDYTGSHK